MKCFAQDILAALREHCLSEGLVFCSHHGSCAALLGLLGRAVLTMHCKPLVYLATKQTHQHGAAASPCHMVLVWVTFRQACHIVFFQVMLASHRAWCYAALAPAKDMEPVLHARSLACPALAALLFAALRALIDGLGVTAFNVAALRMAPDGAPSAAGSPVVVRRARGCKHTLSVRNNKNSGLQLQHC